MSLSLISEAYIVDSDSETGDGKDNDEEGDGNEHGVKKEVLVPEVVDVKQESFPPEEKLYTESNLEEPDNSTANGGVVCESEDDDDKKLKIGDSSSSPSGLGSEDGSKNPGSSEATQIVVEEVENSQSFPGDAVVAPGSSTSSDEFFTRVICRRKKKTRVGNWMLSYRRRQQSRPTRNSTRVKIKRNYQVHVEVDPVDKLNSTSEEGAETDTFKSSPSTVALSSPKRNVQLFRCPYRPSTLPERNELIKHLDIHQVYRSNTITGTPQPHTSNSPSHLENQPAKSSTKRRGKRKRANKSARGKCHKCGIYFNQICHLRRHMKLHSVIGRPWRCNKCDCAFSTKSSLRHHVRTRTQIPIEEKLRHGGKDPSTYTCSICKIPFHSEQYLEKHMMRVHKQTDKSKWKCSLCPSFFLFYGHLQSHETRVHNIKLERGKLSCQVCGKRLAIESLSDHMKIHEETDRPWKCNQCPSFFISKSQLRIHENHFHNRTPGTTRLPCNICRKTFRPEMLACHMKLHVEQGNPWRCSPCSYYFPTKRLLQCHANAVHGGRTHLGGGQKERNEISHTSGRTIRCCRICKFKCSGATRFETHSLQIHRDGSNKAWKCSKCPSFFIRFSSLSTHENRMHGKKTGPILCPLCKRKFNHRSSAFEHLRNMHGYKNNTALLKILQKSSVESGTPHHSPCQQEMSQIRSCKLVLIRCDHLISKFNRASLTDVNDGVEDIEIESDVVPKCINTSIQEQSKMISNGIQNSLRRHGSADKIFGIAKDDSFHTKRAYPCPYCFESFGEPSLLIGHLKLHTELKQEEEGGKPCPDTKSTMKSEGNEQRVPSSSAKIHRKVSSNNSTKHYQCKHCSYSSLQAQFLQNHLKLHSEEGRPFHCTQCGQNFTSFKSLRIHEGHFHKRNSRDIME